MILENDLQITKVGPGFLEILKFEVQTWCTVQGHCFYDFCGGKKTAESVTPYVTKAM